MNKTQKKLLKFKILKLISRFNTIRDIETRAGLYMYIRKLKMKYDFS